MRCIMYVCFKAGNLNTRPRVVWHVEDKPGFPYCIFTDDFSTWYKNRIRLFFFVLFFSDAVFRMYTKALTTTPVRPDIKI